MNTVVSSTRSPQENRLHEHSPPQNQHRNDARRVGLLDRLALHVGVALVAWGRRPLPIESRESLARREDQNRATVKRELAAERMRHLSSPRL